jgi:hypothetical protein
LTDRSRSGGDKQWLLDERHKSDEKSLTKGPLRNLNALRKSIGYELGEKAFTEWLAAIASEGAGAGDKNTVLITEALTPLIKKGLRIPRGGYLLRRGRGRLIVERPNSK